MKRYLMKIATMAPFAFAALNATEQPIKPEVFMFAQETEETEETPAKDTAPKGGETASTLEVLPEGETPAES